jgi:hypothetical protein
MAALGAAALLVLVGCSAGGSDSGGGSMAEVAPDRAAPGVAAPEQAGSARDSGTSAGSGSGSGTSANSAAGTRVGVAEPALIRTAELTVRVDDVPGRARSAQELVRAAGGTIAGDSRSGRDEQARADLTLKVPPGRLDGTLDQLGGLGEELRRTSSTQDVTEEVADVSSRVATMQASIARVRAILSRAERIGDVVAVEGELSRRVTELESLQARQRALSGQVTMASISLHLVARDVTAPPPADRGGFVGGLEDGWRAFTHTVGWVLTAIGALLPFLIVLVPLAMAVRWHLRRQRRPVAPAPAPVAPSAG